MANISHYTCLSALGAGGMGEVLLAEDQRLGRQVALKLLPKDWAQDESRRRRFLSEARAASALNHPNICIIHEVGETEDGRPFIAMEYVEGEALNQILLRGALGDSTVVEYALQLGEALEVAHARGVVHRDIKPSNICITARGLLKVLDFGLAKRLEGDLEAGGSVLREAPTVSGQILGTPAYMSPEQALGRSVDHRSDLFSVGVVMYEMATGRSPFAGASLGDTLDRILHVSPPAPFPGATGVSAALGETIMRCLEKRAGDRFQSAHELVINLKTVRRQMELEPSRVARPAAPVVARPVGVVAVPAGPGSAPSPPVEDLSSSDVFISYTAIDDQPMLGARCGWVSQFCKNLEVRLEQLSGEPVRLWPHSNPTGQSGLDERILRRLPEVKAMISVLSPPFAKSQACRREVEEFWKAARQSDSLVVDSKTRLFKVVKTPVEAEQLPAQLSGVFQQLLGYEFFDVEPETGRLREFSEEFGEEARRRFLERIYDVAFEVNQVLQSLKERSQAKQAPERLTAGPAVFLAETTSDLRVERDQVRRELQERGFVVLPESPLPLVAEEAVVAVRGVLGRVRGAVHLVGQRFGIVPEGGSESLVQLQARLSLEAAAARRLARFIWLPPAALSDDDRQARFLRELREGEVGMAQTELLTGSLEQLKQLVVKQLTAPPPESARPVAAGTVPCVYLLCDAADETTVEPIEDYLYGAGLEVKVPLFEGNLEDLARIHREHLISCDGVLIYFGQASAQWVEMKLMDLLKAQGYGREKPWLAQAIYLAPPDHRRKERFRSHNVEVVREAGGFQPSCLEAFVRRIKESQSRAGTSG